MNLRVAPSGDIKASVPRSASWTAAEAFIDSRKEWLERALAKINAQKSAAPLPDSLCDGGHIRLHGRVMPIAVTCSLKRSVDFTGEVLEVRTPEPKDDAVLVNQIERWQSKEAKRYLTSLTAECLPFFSRFGIGMPSVTIKHMKTRWGSCSVNRAHVNYNIRLLAASEQCARYVVVHELAHFVNASHNKAFYALVASIIPEWKSLRSQLRLDSLE